MKVTVTKYLNVRVGKPSVNAPNYQYLAPGSILEIDGKVYDGDFYDGNNKWYKDEVGNYYWSGGLDNEGLLFPNINISSLWFKRLGIEDIWTNYNERGEKCNILILDTGINNQMNVFIDRLEQPPINFVQNSTTTKSIDKQNHGTHCAGLVSSKSSKYKVGVAPEAKLTIGKINEKGFLKNTNTLKAALKEFLKIEYENKIDIISISQSIALKDDELHKLIKEHIKKSRIIIASIGNDNFEKNLNIKYYPGFYKEVISVGACEIDDELSKYTCYPSAVDIFCFGTNINSYKDEIYPLPLTGTSQATAIVSGICALIVSSLKKRNRPISCDIIKHILKINGTSLKMNNKYKRIQPSLIFKSIQSL